MKETVFPRGIEIVTGAILQKDGKILMAKSPKWSDKWTLPGGHIEIGETIVDACAREVVEETGLVATPIGVINSGELIGSKDFHRPAHFIWFDIVFDVIGGEIKLLADELSDSGWFTVDEALNLDLAEGYDDSLREYKKYLAKGNL